MAPLLAVQTVIIGSCGWCSLRAQDTIGLYFSARGFRFDPYYQKAVLSSEDESLSGKGLFLLTLADSLAERLRTPFYHTLNLHRYPSLAGYVEAPETLPVGWKGLVYIRRLELKGQHQKAVFARSNRLYTERFYRLSFAGEGSYFAHGREIPFQFSEELPSEGWREYLLHRLEHYVRLSLGE
ncbi:MAG: hypothetical protein N2253_02375 [Bacteroidia bacterium]|nr:hypothetical protein [Bacteroidia bacterium]MCX7763722.1 hypothetical protein [Bacteroidia bacterium]MDW8057602.1 hypothetical protein [Bacteroidia bacterium]